MKKSLGIIIVLGFHLSLIHAASADNLCERYQKGLSQLKSSSPVAKQQLETFFSTNSPATNKYDPNWYYLDAGEFVLPIPEKPKEFRPESDGSIVISSSQFTAVIGGDVLREALVPIQDYLKPKKIHSDYDFNLLIFSDAFNKCHDLKTAKDVENKLLLAKIKSLEAPFELKEIFRFSQAQAIVLAGPLRSHKKFSTHFFVRKSVDRSFNGMLFFANKADQDKFLSYFSQIRNKDFFKNGKPFPSKQ
jgi:hypothetical protein